MAGYAAAHGLRRIGVLDLAGDEGVLAVDTQLRVGSYERARDISTLRLARVGAEPPIEPGWPHSKSVTR